MSFEHDPESCPKCVERQPQLISVNPGGGVWIRDLATARLVRGLRDIAVGNWHYTQEESVAALEEIRARIVGNVMLSAWSPEAVEDLRLLFSSSYRSPREQSLRQELIESEANRLFGEPRPSVISRAERCYSQTGECVNHGACNAADKCIGGES